MKTYLHAFAMCQSMFCAIPCPWRVWDEEARPRMLLFLPVIGLEIGLLWGGIAWLCRYFGLSQLIAGVILAAFPYLATGFLHLDGFMDVTDAVKSCRSPERRREILKDSHVGAFAVIACVLVLLTGFAMLASAKGNVGILVLIPVVSRCGSALAVTLLRPISESQYAGAFRQEIPPAHPWILGGMLLSAVAAGFLLFGRQGFCLILEIVGYGLALRRGVSSLGGMNGDIAGYGLTVAELWAVTAFAIL